MNLELATCHALAPAFHDDQPLFDAFAKRGIEARGLAWQDIDGNHPVALRATWDYTQHASEFRAWLDLLDKQGATCINPTNLVRWNMDKRYLLDIAAAGHAIVPTKILDTFSPRGARTIGDEHGWGDVVAKPVTGAGAEGLAVIRADGQAQGFDVSGNTWGEFSSMPTGPCLVQPKLDSIRAGEWSLFYFGGSYSHAVLKIPKAGDIRVQEEHGATSRAAQPPAHVRAAADAIMADQPDAVVARVDGVDDDGFLLMELELIEPELFFRYHPPAVARYCDAVAEALSQA